jgi:hypothetical protein
MALLFQTLLTALLYTIVASLQVSPSSPCSALCISNDGLDRGSATAFSTDTSDIVCSDADYASEKGQKFEACLNCLQKSNYKTDTENDQAWFIYNVRFAADCKLLALPKGPILILAKGVSMATTTQHLSADHVWWKGLAKILTQRSQQA